MGFEKEVPMDKRTINNLKVQIERFNATGKLPREYDVVDSRFVKKDWDGRKLSPAVCDDNGPMVDEDGYIDSEHAAEVLPYTSPEAETLAERREEFETSLTTAEERIFSFVVLGGMSKSKVADMLGVSRPRVSAILNQIRAKATRLIERC